MHRSFFLISSMTALASAFVFGCTDHQSLVEPTDVAPHRVSAAQAPPTEVDPTPFLIEGFCAFDIEAVAAGKAKTVVLPGGRCDRPFAWPHLDLSEPETGREETFVITGAFHFSTLESGAVQLASSPAATSSAPG